MGIEPQGGQRKAGIRARSTVDGSIARLMPSALTPVKDQLSDSKNESA